MDAIPTGKWISPKHPIPYHRHLAPVVQAALTDKPVVCVLGPRQSGKTTLVRQLAPQRAYFSLEDHRYQQIAADAPVGFVASLPDETTLDEVQCAPGLLPAIKLAVDRDRRPGRLLLTGSANLLLPSATESLAGRMEIVHLHPLTEAEKAHRPGRFVADLLSSALNPRLAATQGDCGPGIETRQSAL